MGKEKAPRGVGKVVMNKDRYCKNCKWSKAIGDAYYHTYYCLNPEMQRVDPVTGPSSMRDCYQAMEFCQGEKWEAKTPVSVSKKTSFWDYLSF